MCGYGLPWSLRPAVIYLIKLVRRLDVWVMRVCFCFPWLSLRKTEADVGVSVDIAHFYFSQLVSGMSWMHGKGVAHRGSEKLFVAIAKNSLLNV
jgi:hypothetical protein